MATSQTTRRSALAPASPLTSAAAGLLLIAILAVLQLQIPTVEASRVLKEAAAQDGPLAVAAVTTAEPPTDAVIADPAQPESAAVADGGAAAPDIDSATAVDLKDWGWPSGGSSSAASSSAAAAGGGGAASAASSAAAAGGGGWGGPGGSSAASSSAAAAGGGGWGGPGGSSAASSSSAAASGGGGGWWGRR